MLRIDGLWPCRLWEDEETYRVEVTDELPKGGKLVFTYVCAECGSHKPLIKFGQRLRKFQDLPMHGKRVELLYRVQRYRCVDCGKSITSDVLPEFDEKRSVTTRLINYVVKQAPKRTFTSIAEEIGMDEKTIRNIFNDFHIQRAELPAVTAPRILGIDEAHLLRKMRGVIINVETAEFYDILETRSQTLVTNFLMKMPDRQNVEVVCMDMHRPYLRATHAALKNAVPVIDKFHVLKYATSAMEDVRKHTRELPKEERKTLKHERFVFLKRPHRLDSFQAMNLENWCNLFPELGAAYHAKEAFYRIYDVADRKEAEELYLQWLMDLPEFLEPAFAPLTTAMNNWHKEIFNYFDYRYTNATTEALNGLIKIANRSGRGYTFENLRRKILARDYPSLTTTGAGSDEWDVLD